MVITLQKAERIAVYYEEKIILIIQFQVKEIKHYLETSLISYKELADKYYISKGVIYHINTGRAFKEERDYPIRKEHKIN